MLVEASRNSSAWEYDLAKCGMNAQLGSAYREPRRHY